MSIPRPVQIIRNHLKTIQRELEEAIEAQKVKSAVHTLENLGWTHDGSRWAAPKESPEHSPIHAPVAAGALVSYDSGVFSGHVYVRSVCGPLATVSHIRNTSLNGAQIDEESFSVPVEQLTVRPWEYFTGRNL